MTVIKIGTNQMKNYQWLSWGTNWCYLYDNGFKITEKFVLVTSVNILKNLLRPTLTQKTKS